MFTPFCAFAYRLVPIGKGGQTSDDQFVLLPPTHARPTENRQKKPT